MDSIRSESYHKKMKKRMTNKPKADEKLPFSIIRLMSKASLSATKYLFFVMDDIKISPKLKKWLWLRIFFTYNKNTNILPFSLFDLRITGFPNLQWARTAPRVTWSVTWSVAHYTINSLIFFSIELPFGRLTFFLIMTSHWVYTFSRDFFVID